MGIFYLVRHAHAEWTPDENRPLSTRGKRDAARVADILQQLPIAAIYASPFRRACQTVAPLATRLGLSLQIVTDLRERKLSDGPVDDFSEAVAATWRNPAFAHPAGESNAVAQRRGVTVIQKLLEQYPDQHLVLATHGNLLALLLQHFDPSVDFSFWRLLTMPDIYQLNVDAEYKGDFQRLWPGAT